MVMFNVKAVVDWCLEIKQRKLLDEFLWSTMRLPKNYVSKGHLLLLPSKLNITVFHVLCIEALLRSGQKIVDGHEKENVIDHLF